MRLQADGHARARGRSRRRPLRLTRVTAAQASAGWWGCRMRTRSDPSDKGGRYSSCGMPGSGQARTCVDRDALVTHSEGRATGIGCQATHLHPLQPVRVHEGEAGQRQHTQLWTITTSPQ